MTVPIISQHLRGLRPQPSIRDSNELNLPSLEQILRDPPKLQILVVDINRFDPDALQNLLSNHGVVVVRGTTEAWVGNLTIPG